MTRTKPYQMLIADDDDGFRDVLKSIFEPWFALMEAQSGEDALRILGRHHVDLLVLDMHMDELTGLETIRIVKQMDVVLPCILVTSDSSEELRRQAEDADAWSVLEKPVRKLELLETVSTAIGSTYGDSEFVARLSSLN